MKHHKNRRNMPLYMSVLVAVSREAKKASQVAEELRIQPNSIHRILRLMRGRLVHVASYTKQPHGRPVAHWLLGAEPDAPRPAVLESFDGQAEPRAAGAEMAAFLAIMTALMREPQSMKQLHEVSGCGRDTILRLIRMGRAAKMIHVAEWDRQRHMGDYAPYYALALDKADKQKPRPVPRRQVEQRYWDGRRARERQARISNAIAANANAFSQAA